MKIQVTTAEVFESLAVAALWPLPHIGRVLSNLTVTCNPSVQLRYDDIA